MPSQLLSVVQVNFALLPRLPDWQWQTPVSLSMLPKKRRVRWLTP